MTRLSPEATARVIVQLSRIGFAMSFLVWLTLTTATMVVGFAGAFDGVTTLLVILGAGLLCLVVYLLVTMFLVQQWRLMNAPIRTPLPRKNRTRRIPVVTREGTHYLEVDDRVGE